VCLEKRPERAFFFDHFTAAGRNGSSGCAMLVKKAAGVAISLIPFVVVLLCGFYGWTLNEGQWTALGYSLLGLGGLISVVNFYLSALRYPIFRLIHGKTAEFKWISGFPLLGSISIIGFLFLPKSSWLVATEFLLLSIDSGGLHWFVISTWNDEGLWKSPK